MEPGVLKVALDLAHMPARVRLVRRGPLPDGIPQLLRVATADGDALDEAARTYGRTPEVVRHAADFFIEQVLFSPDADSYRVLGCERGATPGELRQNMALLVRWLHAEPDGVRDRSVFFPRVTLAWNDLKTQDRRSAYDLAAPPVAPAPVRKRESGGKKRVDGKSRSRNGGTGHSRGHTAQPGFWTRLWLTLFGRRSNRRG
ncbi:hypothetical protein [Aquabacter spiritensis]|uniref:J domain-containing protein n=1 Tax=Aquabacter spiritensis TaxID=933073 RepID=A0A4R3LU36_9HYPH|nr:hypothetical protein [Aquabacter spiritensis]TCT03981.1 hypothetical protein EDC64_108147 [Aquabacter spiritensis]